jgi:hypothetical protein
MEWAIMLRLGRDYCNRTYGRGVLLFPEFKLVKSGEVENYHFDHLSWRTTFHSCHEPTNYQKTQHHILFKGKLYVVQAASEGL